MAETLNYLIINFVLPGTPVILLAFAWLARARFAKTARLMFWATLAAWWLAATPALGLAWAGWLESQHAALPLEGMPAADAIVVLSGGRRPYAPELGSDTLREDTLERTRYGAMLAKRSGLPVIVSGGQINQRGTPLAVLMQRALQTEFGVAKVQAETQSTTTLENAQYVAQQLGSGKTIVLVTSAIHMPRAVQDFRSQGVRVVAAPTAYRSDPQAGGAAWVPSVAGLRLFTEALRETLGCLRSYARGL